MTAYELANIVKRGYDIVTDLDPRVRLSSSVYNELTSITEKVGFVCNYPSKFPLLNQYYGEIVNLLVMAEMDGYKMDENMFFSTAAWLLQNIKGCIQECGKI